MFDIKMAMVIEASIEGNISTRASSIRQMWLEREDECVVNRGNGRGGRSRVYSENNQGLSNYQERENRNGAEYSSESENGSVINSEIVNARFDDHHDHQSLASERSQDLGNVEGERVRRIFQELKNNGGVSNVEMTSQSREEQVCEVGSQIDQGVGNNEGLAENSRRLIRRLCGRQALLDLLAKIERERRQELQGLEASRRVSDFSHRKRNRIQSVLSIRYFQNIREFELRSPGSTASELGLLRERQTVSALREGFLLNNVQAQVNDFSGNSSENNVTSFRDDTSQTNSTNEVVDIAHDHSPPTIEVHNGLQEPNEPSIEIGSPEQSEPLKETLHGICSQSDPERDSGVGPSDECTRSHQLDEQIEARPEITSDEENTSEIPSNDPPIGSSNEICLPMNSQKPSTSGIGESSVLVETREMSDCFDTNSDEIILHNNQLVEGVQVSEDLNGQEFNVQVEDWPEQVSMSDQIRWQGSVSSNQWRDDDQLEIDEQRSLGDGEGISQSAIESEVGEQNDTQEDYWHGNGSLETPQDWLGIPSNSEVYSRRLDNYDFSDDENVYHMELRELVNSGTVSRLLHSEFRESLDQLVQSYVERQTLGPDEWGLHEISLSHFQTQNRDYVYDGEESDERSQQGLPRPPPLPQAHWSHHPTLSRRVSRQRRGTEWEIINDLRIEVARLQQRLNNMQGMLETCMDMQLELQRSVRQEVSATLNRTTTSSELPENTLPEESYKLDFVRKGICCICSNTNIDSLLYRCGHMCTCIKCADLLIQGNRKCPMCQAPVIEAIRAYFTQ